jgi:pyruvate/2-oxoglutarate dehydrogenase complex dihydrolipoamide dehydrogenase (E3) component
VYALFTDPPLGRAGMGEHEVRASGRRARVARLAMEKVSRAKERGETQGLMKILVDAGNGHILGAAFLGIEGDEAIHAILDAMYAGATFETLRRAVHIHPTVSEFIPTMMGELEDLA